MRDNNSTEKRDDFRAVFVAKGFDGDISNDLAARVVGSTDNRIYLIEPGAIIFSRTAQSPQRIVALAGKTPLLSELAEVFGSPSGLAASCPSSALIERFPRKENTYERTK